MMDETLQGYLMRENRWFNNKKEEAAAENDFKYSLERAELFYKELGSATS
jgi:hypothetical protein